MENDKKQPWKCAYKERFLRKEYYSEWKIDLIKAYQNKEFSVNEVVDFYDSDAFYIVVDEINNKLKKEGRSPFKLMQNKTLLNETEQEYYQQIDGVVKNEVRTIQLRLF